MNQIKKIKRIGNVISILSKYGFDDIIARTSAEKFLPKGFLKSKRGEEIFKLGVYKRVRLVLEELGPTYVKLGQMFSNREDILPPEMIAELSELQDNVPPEDMDIFQKLADELLIDPQEQFEYINPTPIASASISQVYVGRLINGEKVVIKVKRTTIEEIIRSDIMIMKDLANILEKNYDTARKMSLKQLINSFENNMYRELSLTNELHNIEKFRKNFENRTEVYVPQTYKELSNNNMLTMEFVDGFKVNNKEKIIENGMLPKDVAQTGIVLFMKMVLEDGFFHADPHPGNVFIMNNQKFCFIDFGSMGQIMKGDMALLEEIIESFMIQDAKKIIRLTKRLAIEYHIEDEKTLEREIYDIFHMLEHTALNEINVNDIVAKVKSIMANNHVLMPEFIYLLMRGISIIEGIGKQLDPELNVMESMRPYANELALKKYGPKQIAQKSIKHLKILAANMQNLPDDLTVLLEKIKDDKLKINFEVEGLEDVRQTLQNASNRLTYAIIIAALSIGSSILMMAHIPPLFYGNSFLGLLGFLISGILGIVIIYSIWKKDK
ncbi:AarF/UbiB family protein [Flavobacterium sp. CBA20B-1]|uniref:ABC1 kinase family protein n=1 Tax=unclassified Flavobacterium TaxID=196869 RepID=UPI002225831B|nr:MULTISPECIES: AarF/UbiB family protein [unclassified Flavobacterium]WCM42504.1 AarF/UbiB family protein [Flavobacterium sp. CBA20B-1]